MILNSYDIKYLFMKFINRGEGRRNVFEKIFCIIRCILYINGMEFVWQRSQIYKLQNQKGAVEMKKLLSMLFLFGVLFVFTAKVHADGTYLVIDLETWEYRYTDTEIGRAHV